MADFVADKVVKEFERPESNDGPLRVLNEIDLQLDRGQNLAVVGPSGAGKSTFLHIAGTLDSPTSGIISLNGNNPAGLSEKQLAKFRNKHIGFVFQEHHLLPQLTALENVLIPTVASGDAGVDMVQRAEALLESVGLSERMTHRPAALSGGERQRVAVARSLICEPLLVLADEPTGSLDQKNANAIGELLLDLQTQNQTIMICVTHNENLASLFGQKVELVNGKFESVV